MHKPFRRFLLFKDTVFLRRHGLLDENLNARHEIPSHEILVRELIDAPKTTQTLAIALGCPQNWKIRLSCFRPVMIYSAGDPAGPLAGVGDHAAGKGQTDMPCRESLGMESLFSGYWKGMGA